MGQNRTKNIALYTLGRMIAPGSLWTRRFTAAWLACAATVMIFDLLWCYQTTFRALGFVGTWVNLLLLATAMALPSVATRRRWVQAMLILLFIGMGCANLMYCLTYFNAIPLKSYALASNVAGFTASIVDSLRWRYVLLLVPMAVWLLWPQKSTGNYRRTWRSDRPAWTLYLITLGVLTVASTANALASGGLRSHIRWLHGQCYYATTPCVIYTIPGALIAEIGQTDTPLSPERADEIDDWFSQHDALTAINAPADSIVPAPENIIMVFCESLESWPIGAKVEGKELTPNLNRLIADTAARVWFAPHVLSQASTGRSIDGQLLMLAGMYPLPSEVWSMSYPHHRYPSLPDAMRSLGAQTWLLSGDKPSTWNQGLVARAFGIDHTLMADAWDKGELIGHPARISDASFIRQIIDRMEEGEIWPEGTKAYVQIVTYTGHNPFRIPERLRTITLTEEYPDRLADYMTAVHYTDSAIGSLIDYLKKRPDWNRTMLVIVGDHEGLAARREAMRSTDATAVLVNEVGFVPLIVVNGATAGIRKDVMGQVDVYTTILDHAALPYRSRGLGFSALRNSPTFAVSPQGQIVGDTVGIAQPIVENILKAPAVSADIIRYDMAR